MQDRAYIKWAPFNSLISDKTIINEILVNKAKISKPVLSEDQLSFLNEKIFEAYTTHIKVNLYIYKYDNIHKLTGFVNNIDMNMKYITFNKEHIYFNQIIRISNFFEEI